MTDGETNNKAANKTFLMVDVLVILFLFSY